MALIQSVVRQSAIALDASNASERGLALRPAYLSAQPFPHMTFDDLFDTELLTQAHAEVSRVVADADAAAIRFTIPQQKLKSQFDPETLPSDFLRNLFQAMNSYPFLLFLEGLTGIKHLIPDPYFVGGGIHQTKADGRLGIHADFTIHKELQLRRRVNLIVYLNRDWPDAYGGAIELWKQDMSACALKVAPRFGTSLIFNTDATSYHGHPDPLTCPADRSRLSLALYYYTAENEWVGAVTKRNTRWNVRPGSKDPVDWEGKARDFFSDITPPALSRLLRRHWRFRRWLNS